MELAGFEDFVDREILELGLRDTEIIRNKRQGAFFVPSFKLIALVNYHSFSECAAADFISEDSSHDQRRTVGERIVE